VDVDIYNRFDEYYREKITIDGDKFGTENIKLRSQSLESGLARTKLRSIGLERGFIHKKQSLRFNLSHICFGQEEFVRSAKISKSSLGFIKSKL
jgi:hypothetical protein